MIGFHWSLMTLVCALISDAGADLTGACFPNNTIVVSGLDPTVRHVAVSQARLSCSYDRSGGTLVITGCIKDVAIDVIMTNVENIADPFTSLTSWQFTCREIPSDGVTWTLVHELVAGITTEQTILMTPTIHVTSGFRASKEDAAFIIQAHVGDLVYFTLDIHSAIELEVLECWAEPMAADGTIKTALSMKIIDTHGCSLFPDLISAFMSPFLSSAGTWRSHSALRVFKFYSYPLLQLSCTVRVCRYGSEHCQTSCSGTRRRRASEISTADGSVVSTTHDVIRVLDAQPLEATASQGSSNLCLALVSVTAVLLRSQAG